MKPKKFPPSVTAIALLASTASSPAALIDGLVNYWDFNGNLTDTANTAPHVDPGSPTGAVTDNGTFVNNPSVGYAAGSPVGGSYALFDGETGYITVPNSADTNANGESLTIAAWLRVDAFDTNWQALISKGEGDNYRVHRHGGSPTAMAYYGGNVDIAGGAVNDSRWHHLVATTTSGVGTELWIDGVSVNTGGGAATITDSGGALFIGENPGAPGRQWEGGIDEIAMWERAITPAEISLLYRGGYQGLSLAAIPEPTKAVTSLLGIAACLLHRRRKRTCV